MCYVKCAVAQVTFRENYTYLTLSNTIHTHADRCAQKIFFRKRFHLVTDHSYGYEH